MTCLGLLYPLLRSFLFRLDAEQAHHLTLDLLRGLHASGLLRPLAWGMPSGEPVTVAGLSFPNRLGLAAGLDKSALCAAEFGAMGFGFVEVGTLTPWAQPGNPSPRLFRLVEERAIINRMGFNNPGIDQGVANLSRSPKRPITGINIGKNATTPNDRAEDDYAAGFRKAAPLADYVAANLSSPNTKGLRDLQSAKSCESLINRLRQEQSRYLESSGRRVPLFIKIAPDLDEEALRSLADVFANTGLDGVIATNTTISRREVIQHPLAGQTGGLSGAPLSKRATEVVASLRSLLPGGFPIIASGGIMDGADARDKFEAGADLVQIYTGFVYRGPALMEEILRLKVKPTAP